MKRREGMVRRSRESKTRMKGGEKREYGDRRKKRLTCSEGGDVDGEK